jgi:DNA-binding transcriptional LysR family regulator
VTGGRRQVPTEAAATVTDYAHRVLGHTADIARWIEERRSGRTGVLRLGMIDAAAVHHFPDQLLAFRRAHPRLDLRLTVSPSGELLPALRRARLDAVVCVAPADAAELEVTHLLDEPLVVVAPPSSRTAWGERWVLFPTGSLTRALIERTVRSRGEELVVAAESHQPEVLAEMVRLGLGWSVLPAAQADGLRKVGRHPLATRQIVAATRSGGPQHPAAATLIAALVDGR